MNKLFIIILILVIIIIFLLIYQKRVENFKVCDYDHLVLNKQQLKDTRELLEKFIKIADELDIKYFAVGGTLIGTIRNGGLIPFDDDVDLGILINDVPKIHKYESDEYYFGVCSFGYKFKKKDCDMFIDIFVFEKDEHEYKIINDLWPGEAITSYELHPVKKNNFGDIKINVPNNSKKYLDRAFKDWDKKLRIDCGHYSDECTYEKYGLEKELPIDYEDSKFMCYTNL